jgi:predicted nucleotidyltransferase
MFKLSKNEALLLRLFFTNPGAEFYIQEIGRILGKKPGVFQRTLYNLEEQGILASQYKANARYFRVNEGHPLFEEMKSIIAKTVGLVGSLKEVLRNAGSIDFAFIYGSFAKSSDNPLSDIDLMIIGSPDESVLLQRLSELEHSMKREINYRIYSSIDYVRDIQGAEPFLLNILADRKIFLIGEEYELRKMAEGSPDQETGSGS